MQFKQYRDLFNNYLETKAYQVPPQELYDPINYIMGLGGKRMRPILLMLAYRLYQDDVNPCLAAALAVEVFHNFTLIHDDIMDAAPIRRGNATVHIKYGTNTGILSGDAMSILSYQLLSQTGNPEKTHDLVSVFSKVAIKVCEGQQYDVNFESRNDVSIAEYINMIEMKTAVLLAGSLEMGAILGNASQADRDHLYEFGRLSGIAFQIQDDYLDVFGNPEKVGKQVGGDILQNKKTILYLETLQQASSQEGESFSALYRTNTNGEAEQQNKIAQVTGIMESLAIPEKVAKLRDEYQAKAYAHLEAVQTSSERKAELRNFAEWLLRRDS